MIENLAVSDCCSLFTYKQTDTISYINRLIHISIYMYSASVSGCQRQYVNDAYISYIYTYLHIRTLLQMMVATEVSVYIERQVSFHIYIHVTYTYT